MLEKNFKYFYIIVFVNPIVEPEYSIQRDYFHLHDCKATILESIVIFQDKIQSSAKAGQTVDFYND